MSQQTIAHFEILEKLGEGGAAVVYKARDLRLDRLVALKLLSPRLLDSPDAVRRFQREARFISSLNHPHIATLYEVGEDNTRQFLVLEYLPGGTLRTRLDRLRATTAQLPFRYLVKIGEQIARGLAYAHRHRVIHRDIKPANILFTEEDAVKITDFGLAKYVAMEPTTPGLIAGTFAYMSPEQAQGFPLDPRSDLFSLGIVLYEMAAGRPPFSGANAASLLRDIVYATPPPLPPCQTELPAEFEQVILRALEKDPEKRYPRAEDLLQKLERFHETGATPGLNVSLREGPTVSLPGPATSPPIERRPARRKIIVAALALLAVFAGIFAVRLGLPGFRRLPADKSLAVLPFSIIGGDQAYRPFCDGLVEALAAKLVQLEQFQGPLRVVAPTEVRAQQVTTAEAARQAFGVALALTGSMQRSDNRVLLHLNLVDAHTLLQLRTATVAAQIGDLPRLRETVLEEAAKMLEVALQPRARTLLQAGETGIAAAYELYLEGIGYLSRFDQAENIDLAIHSFQLAVSQDRRYALGHAGLGEAYWRKYQVTKDPAWIEEARKSCSEAIRLNGQLARAHVSLGVVLTNTGKFEPAVEEFEKALQLDPVNADAHRELAYAYESMSNVKEAEKAYREAVRLRPGDWNGYNELALYYYRHGDYRKAEQHLLRVLTLTPGGYLAYKDLGGLYSLMGRPSEAREMLWKSIAVRPTGAAYSNLGFIDFQEARYQEAAMMFEKAVELRPADRRLWGNLADAYRQIPEHREKATAAYRRAIDLAERDLSVNPNNAELRASLAVYYAVIFQKKRAFEEIRNALRQAPQNVNTLFRAALVYETAGDRRKSLGMLSNALRGGYSLAEAGSHPDLAALRRDPRYEEMLASLNLSQPLNPR